MTWIPFYLKPVEIEVLMIKICVKKDAKEAEKSASYIIPRKMNFVENCIYNSHWIPGTVMIELC